MTRTELEKEIAVMEELRENLTERIHDVSSSIIEACNRLDAMKESERLAKKEIDDLL